MDFRKYQSIQRYGKSVVKNITHGTCYIFPKIDGTNASIWRNAANEVCCGSRNQSIGKYGYNHGFGPQALDTELWNKALDLFPDCTIYGEWLVPHTLRTYKNDAWKRFYIFDVVSDDEYHIPYPEYYQKLHDLGLDVIEPLAVIDNPTNEELVKLACEDNTFLIKEGKGVGEGIVIKNYNFSTYGGRQVWAKMYSADYRNKGDKRPKSATNTTAVDHTINFLDKFFKPDFISKEVYKIINSADLAEGEEFHPRLIKHTLNIVDIVIEEELVDYIKKHKMPTINFGKMKKEADRRVIQFLKDKHLL